jgi:hypothetical protein
MCGVMRVTVDLLVEISTFWQKVGYLVAAKVSQDIDKIILLLETR